MKTLFLKKTDTALQNGSVAADLMNPGYISLSAGMCAEEALEKIRKTGTAFYTLYITDGKHRLTGTVALCDLLTCAPQKTVAEFADWNPAYITYTESRERAAKLFQKYGLLSLPVTNERRVLLGVIPVDNAIDAIRKEATEDFEKMAAISTSPASYFETSDLSHAKNRLPWLLVLMLSSVFTGAVITRYEEAFLTLPLLISFLPMLMDTAGNCGSQSSTVIIRGLATGEIHFRDFFRVLLKESAIALMASGVLILFCTLRVLLQYHDPMLALVLSSSLCCTVLLSKLTGAALPILAQKLHLDPAAMASPMINTVADLGTVLLYFSVASRLLCL